MIMRRLLLLVWFLPTLAFLLAHCSAAEPTLSQLTTTPAPPQPTATTKPIDIYIPPSEYNLAQTTFDLENKQLGSVTLLEGECDPGFLPNTRCLNVEVTCDYLDPISGVVRITEPSAGIQPQGMVVFGRGGDGLEAIEDMRYGDETLQKLVDDGFIVVQRLWDSSWQASEFGMVAATCRYATLLTWIHDSLHSAGAFCAMGNSGGSDEVAYALTHWDRASLLDFVLITSGPPMARIDMACLDGDNPTWRDRCWALVQNNTECRLDGAVPQSCSFQDRAPLAPAWVDRAFSPDAPCGLMNDERRAELLRNSILAPDAQLDYPDTPVHFLYGTQDCTETVAFGLLYARAITSQTNIAFVAGAPHRILQSPEAGRQVAGEIKNFCRVTP